jgi:hypothetical protein
MVGGSLRLLRLLPPPNLVAMIELKYYTKIHDLSLYWLGTDTSIKHDEVAHINLAH